MPNSDLSKFDRKYPIPQPRSEITALEMQLSRIASEWRVTKDAVYVKRYHDIYHRLVSLGWDNGVDAEAELPYELMPEHYLDVLRGVGWVIDDQGNVLGLEGSGGSLDI